MQNALVRNPQLKVAPPKEALAGAEVVFVATPYEATAAALEAVAVAVAVAVDVDVAVKVKVKVEVEVEVEGKVDLDVDVDVAVKVKVAVEGKILVDCTNPVGANLSHGLNSECSGWEVIQALMPGCQLVKAFTSYGFENFEDSAYPAYNVQPVMPYCGNAAAAKATVAPLISTLGWEPMTLLWVRMVRVNGHSPNLVWAALRR